MFTLEITFENDNTAWHDDHFHGVFTTVEEALYATLTFHKRFNKPGLGQTHCPVKMAVVTDENYNEERYTVIDNTLYKLEEITDTALMDEDLLQ